MTLHYLKFPEPSPWKTRNKKKKVAFCQRQIERLERWLADDACPRIKSALSEWIDVKKAVVFGKL